MRVSPADCSFCDWEVDIAYPIQLSPYEAMALVTYNVAVHTLQEHPEEFTEATGMQPMQALAAFDQEISKLGLAKLDI